MAISRSVRQARNGKLLVASTSALLAAFAAGCTPKSTSTAETADAQSTADDAAVAAAEPPVEPPAAVVPQDPQIPLNEAVVGSAPVAEDFYAASAPPAAVVEAAPPQPAPSNVWIPGYWWWSPPLGRYAWVSGAWRNPPPEQVWYPGSWNVVSPERYAWTPGLWGPRGFVRDAVGIGVAPPVFRVETYGAPPSPGFAWRSGYYGYQGGNYVWVGGGWERPPVVGLGWVEPRYVGVFGHYYFQPGRWDFAAEARGTVYMPDINVRPGEHISLVVAPVAVVSARVQYVSACSRAVSHGAVRTASGAYVPPVHGAAAAHGSVPGEARVEVTGHGGAAAEAHGGAAAEVHAGAAAEAHGGGAAEPHGAAEGHSGTEPRPGAGDVHGAAEAHGGAADFHGGGEAHPAATPKPAAAPAAPQKKPKGK